ncbi:MAG: DeoR/GlpR family DNA-binding transcription regulator [Geminicoccaceae bacterium]
MKQDRTARHRRILAELEQRPSLRVSQLAERLRVSAETIRRDLDALTDEGLIDRTYGGATRRRSLEPCVSERHNMKATERERIARAACPRLAGSSHVMIGSGATTVHVARRLALEMNNLTVIAHSFGVATVLSLNPTITVLLAPGQYHAGEGAVHGAATLEWLDGFNVDWAILGASGLDGEGAMDALIEAGEVYRKMASRATRTMIVADATKFERRFPALWSTWTGIDSLVTDAQPPDEVAAPARASGTEIIVA